MGSPFKDALKTICGINQWSYGVFWKIGCQNPKFLIWEDCYYQGCEFANSSLSHEAFEHQLPYMGEGVHFLVNKMMMENQVHVVGQGLVGCAAFEGKYEWIVSGSFNEFVHQPEVLREFHLQFSAGMQTIAVIPVMPHGVIQLGSSMAMPENVYFIQDVRTLIQQLAGVPSIHLSGKTVRDGSFEEFGSPCNGMNSVYMDPYGNMENLGSNVAFDGGKWQPSTVEEAGSSHSFKQQATNKAVPLAPDVLLKQLSCSYDLHSGSIYHQEHNNDDNLFSASATEAICEEDLFDALGIDFRNNILNGSSFQSIKDELDTANQMMQSSLDLTSFLDPDCDRMPGSELFLSRGSDHLLDAVVTGAQSSSDNLSCTTTLTQVYGDCRTNKLFAQSKPVKNAQTSGSQVRSWVDQGPSVVTANSKNFKAVDRAARKKSSPAGQKPKPRPKDRQLIQDRLKELREIIPNGAKCSIDVLLEQTIKHMVFLQSVDKHADKLNQKVESKFDGGVTWAYEVGCQAKMCPIIVEDLHPPNQFLVEMMCEEQGLFLEIADIIKGMGLTILKGTIEKRSDKIWAQFAVEAKRQMTRVEIFLSLVNLMENKFVKNNNSSGRNEEFDYSTLVHSRFDPAKSVFGS